VSAQDLFREGFARMRESGELPWDLLADDFVWDMSNVPWHERAEYVGFEGVTEFMGDWIASWDDWHTEPVELVEVGDQMVVVSVQTGRARGSGVPVEMTYAQIWSRDPETGKATRARMYENREQALEVAQREAANRSPS
jgi:ketosteroid isomerase-like protein